MEKVNIFCGSPKHGDREGDVLPQTLRSKCFFYCITNSSLVHFHALSMDLNDQKITHRWPKNNKIKRSSTAYIHTADEETHRVSGALVSGCWRVIPFAQYRYHAGQRMHRRYRTHRRHRTRVRKKSKNGMT